MRSSGKLVVLFILGIAIAMASFAWWWNHQQGRKAIEFWGADVREINDAETVKLIKLVPVLNDESTTPDASEFSSLGLKAGEAKDIGGVHGLLHARHSFLEDASYRWSDTPPLKGTPWQYAIVFQGEFHRTTALLDLSGGSVGSWEKKRAVRLSPKTAAGWKEFIGRYFPEDSTASTAKAK